MVDCASKMRVSPNLLRAAALCACAALLAACGSAPKKEVPSSGPPEASSSSTKYYKDDGPGDSPPDNLDTIPDVTPRLEPLSRFANRPYTVLGKDYVPATTLRAYKELNLRALRLVSVVYRF